MVLSPIKYISILLSVPYENRGCVRSVRIKQHLYGLSIQVLFSQHGFAGRM